MKCSCLLRLLDRRPGCPSHKRVDKAQTAKPLAAHEIQNSNFDICGAEHETTAPTTTHPPDPDKPQKW